MASLAMRPPPGPVTRERLLEAAEARGWPPVAVGLIRLRGGEIAWRQTLTLSTDAERERLARWLTTAGGDDGQ
jgi:hypothetical protein